MADSTFSADLDALVRGESIASDDKLTRFVSDLYGEEQNVTMPNALKLRIANDLGLNAAAEPARMPAPVSRRTLREMAPPRRSSRPWAIALAVAAAILLALTGVLRWGMPTNDNDADNQFLLSSPAVPTVSATPSATPGTENELYVPVAAAECDEDELIDRGEWMQLQNERAASYDPDEPRADEPFSPANAEDAEAVAERQQQAMACQNRGDNPEERASEALPIESPARAWEMRADSETFQAIQQDRFERSKVFSSWVEDEMGLTPDELSHQTEGDEGLFWSPDHAVELGDGRIALLPGWMVLEDQQPLESIEFYAPVWNDIDGEWLFEEELFFCIGDCEEYWDQLESLFPNESTPTASPEVTAVVDEEWLQPIDVSDCPDTLLSESPVPRPNGHYYSDEEHQAASYERSYGPYSAPDRDTAEDVAEARRQYEACRSLNELEVPLWTSRYEFETRTADGRQTNSERSEETDSASLEMSEWFQQERDLSVEDVVFEVDGAVVGLESDAPSLTTTVYLPEHTVELGDGRIAILESQVSFRPATQGVGDTQDFIQVMAAVFAHQDDQWLLDEYLSVCIGDCEEYWAQQESQVPIGYDESWMIPAEPEECVTDTTAVDVDADPQDFDAEPRREYQVVGPANPADAMAANEIARQSQACGDPSSLWSSRLAMENELAGEEFSPYTIVVLQQQWEDGQVISDALEAEGLQPTDFLLVAGGDNPMFADVDDGSYFVSNPYMALELADGRVVIPWIDLTVAKDEMSGAKIQQWYVGTALVLADEDGSWKVDGQLPICVGDCDAVWDKLDGMILDAVYLIPVNAAECDVNTYLPDDLGEAEAAVARSRQYIACHETGDATGLHGPEFRVTDGEEAQALSEEIADKHRQNGETPGSLQRIANTLLWDADVELPNEAWTVYQPSSVVMLEDGRVAVLESTVVTPEMVSGTGRTSPVVTTALVWIVDGETWLLDEQVTVCLGDCDEFWGTDSTPATPVASPPETGAVVIPEVCEATEAFQADFTSHDRLPIQLRPEPITEAGVYVEVLTPRTELHYLCESEETSNPAQDRMEAGDQWLKVRTEDGTEGWIREMDVRELVP